MKNRYALCYLCQEFVYMYKKCLNTSTSSELFFNKRNGVEKHKKIFCLSCYKQVYVNKNLKLKRSALQLLFDFNM